MSRVCIFERNLFCDFYNSKTKKKANLNDNKLFNLIKDNLAVLRDLNNEERFHFNKRGEILCMQRLTPCHNTKENLFVFAKFVKKYFKKKKLNLNKRNYYVKI